MKQTRTLILFVIFLSIVSLAACGPATENLDTAALESTAQAHLTSVAYLNETAEFIAQKTDSVLPSLPPTQTYAPTVTKRPRTVTPATPGPSPTITATPTATHSPTPTPLAKALVNGDTNCRTGPSKSYPWVTMVPAGTTVDIIARDITGQYYVIENPFDDNVCWLWNTYVTLVGPVGQLPRFANPPTPRPTRAPRDTAEPRFRIYEEGLIECDGQYALVIRVRNYTRDGFGSWRARVFNSPNNQHQTTVAGNQFSHKEDECEMTINKLPYRQTGYAIIPMDPTQANRYLIEFEACTLENKKGGCAFDGIYVEKDDILPTPTSPP